MPKPSGSAHSRITSLPKNNQIFSDVGRVERLPISAVSPPRRALRTYTAAHKKQYAKCLDAFGFVVPIIIDTASVIVAGLVWYFGALHLELPELPVIRATHLSPEQIEAYRIAEQRLNEIAPWDDQVLAETLFELSKIDLGFSLEVTGFSMGEIDFRIENLSVKSQEDLPDTADEVPAVSAKAVSELGDVWTLGRHRILCANFS